MLLKIRGATDGAQLIPNIVIGKPDTEIDKVYLPKKFLKRSVRMPQEMVLNLLS